MRFGGTEPAIRVEQEAENLGVVGQMPDWIRYGTLCGPCGARKHGRALYYPRGTLDQLRLNARLADASYADRRLALWEENHPVPKLTLFMDDLLHAAELAESAKTVLDPAKIARLFAAQLVGFPRVPHGQHIRRADAVEALLVDRELLMDGRGHPTAYADAAGRLVGVKGLELAQGLRRMGDLDIVALLRWWRDRDSRHQEYFDHARRDMILTLAGARPYSRVVAPFMRLASRYNRRSALRAFLAHGYASWTILFQNLDDGGLHQPQAVEEE